MAPEAKLYRNNREKPLIRNGSLRHGQFPHHTADCMLEDYGFDKVKYYEMPSHGWWCATHGQWASETPVKVTYTFSDGTTLEKEFK